MHGTASRGRVTTCPTPLLFVFPLPGAMAQMCLHVPVVNYVGQNPPYPMLRKICSTRAECYFIPYLGELKAGQQDFVAIVNQSSCGLLAAMGKRTVQQPKHKSSTAWEQKIQDTLLNTLHTQMRFFRCKKNIITNLLCRRQEQRGLNL